MKIINLGKHLINLDMVIDLDTEAQTLIMMDGIRIRLSEDQIDKFVFEYNLYDTDETKLLLERIARVVLSNPEYLSKEGIQEQITIMVKYHGLEDYFKEISEGTKLKELQLTKLLNVYKLIQEKVREIKKDAPF